MLRSKYVFFDRNIFLTVLIIRQCEKCDANLQIGSFFALKNFRQVYGNGSLCSSAKRETGRIVKTVLNLKVCTKAKGTLENKLAVLTVAQILINDVNIQVDVS